MYKLPSLTKPAYAPEFVNLKNAVPLNNTLEFTCPATQNWF